MYGHYHNHFRRRCKNFLTFKKILKFQSIKWLDEIVAKAKHLKLGYGLDKSVDLGPITNRPQLERIHKLIESCAKEGGKILLDGRNPKVDNYPQGNWIGPTVLSNLNTSMTCYKEEIFGPVMCVLTAKNLDEALNIINR